MERPTETKRFESFFTIRHTEMDGYGHLNNATYLRYYDEARWECLSEVGLNMDYVKINNKGFVVVDISIKYEKEVQARDQIKIITYAVPSNKLALICFNQEMINIKNKTIVSRSTTNLAMMNFQNKRVEKPPQEAFKWLGLIP